jgi:hypothetical protein
LRRNSAGAAERAQELVDGSHRFGLIELGRVADARHDGELHRRDDLLHLFGGRGLQKVALGAANYEQRLLPKRCEERPKIDVRRWAGRLERLGDRHVIVEANLALFFAAIAFRHLHPILMGVTIE